LRLIADLDAGNFRRRDAAAKALAELGPPVVPVLRESLRRAKSVEQTRRIEALLARLRREPTPDDWRALRAVQVLELTGTPAARELLRAWAGGAPGVPQTEHAKAALARAR
jgi:HEAT repeat protein